MEKEHDVPVQENDQEKPDESNEKPEEESVETKSSGNGMSRMKYGLLIIVIGLVAFNQYSLLDAEPVSVTGAVTEAVVSSSDAYVTLEGKPGFAYSDTGDPMQDAANAVFATGEPEYSEADVPVNFDDVEKSLTILANIDRAIDTNALPPEIKQRYIDILTPISCEYCCGAKSVIFPDGRAACGCAHSFAMRGVTKLLLAKYGDSYTDDDITREVQYWKARFFPGGTLAKAEGLIRNNMPITFEALNDRDLLKKIETGDMESIGLPGMVGGC